MLKTPAPFPNVGSYALLIDTTLPEEQQRAELVRIMRHGLVNGYHPPGLAGRRSATGTPPSPRGLDGRSAATETPPSPCRNVGVAFPLRTGASGNRLVYAEDLIDGTPLSKAEERELADLQRALRQQVRPNRKKVDRAESLRRRLVFSQLLAAELKKLRAQESRGLSEHGVPKAWEEGARLPRHAA